MSEAKAINQNIIKPNINWKHQSETSETSSKCGNNSTTHDIKYKNLCSNLNLADFKTQEEENIPKLLRILVRTYRQSFFTGKIEKWKDTKIKLHINNWYHQLARQRDVSHPRCQCNKETYVSWIIILDRRHHVYNYIQFYISQPRDQITS